MSERQFKCSYCKKTYSRKIYYERHLICCSIKAMATLDDKRTLEEFNDTPSIQELYLIIQELVKKQNKMEEEIKSLRKYSPKGPPKVDVDRWLEDYKPSEFNTWTDCIKINNKELNFIFENGILNGIFNVLKNNLPLESDNPIRAFEHKGGTLFVFQNKKWNPLNNEDFKKLISKINRRVVIEFKEWTKEQREANQLQKYPYDDYVMMIFTNNIKESEIKTKLYDYLKISIKSITKIEI